jgi:hypothetical protein
MHLLLLKGGRRWHAITYSISAHARKQASTHQTSKHRKSSTHKPKPTSTHPPNQPAAPTCAMQRHTGHRRRRRLRSFQRRPNQRRLRRPIWRGQAAAAPVLVDRGAVQVSQDSAAAAAAAVVAIDSGAASWRHHISRAAQQAQRYCFPSTIAVGRGLERFAAADRGECLQQADAGRGLQGVNRQGGDGKIRASVKEEKDGRQSKLERLDVKL